MAAKLMLPIAVSRKLIVATLLIAPFVVLFFASGVLSLALWNQHLASGHGQWLSEPGGYLNPRNLLRFATWHGAVLETIAKMETGQPVELNFWGLPETGKRYIVRPTGIPLQAKGCVISPDDNEPLSNTARQATLVWYVMRGKYAANSVIGRIQSAAPATVPENLRWQTTINYQVRSSEDPDKVLWDDDYGHEFKLDWPADLDWREDVCASYEPKHEILWLAGGYKGQEVYYKLDARSGKVLARFPRRP